MKIPRTLPALLEAFFSDRLMTQRRASRHTIASYRDTFRLLLRFLQERFNKHPSDLALQDMSAPVICGFLNYLEQQRGNKPRSRNVRLAAIRSFFHYVAFEEPGQADLIQRVLAIPGKRWHRQLVCFLSPSEADAVTQAPDCRTCSGRRDHALLRLAIQTGLRVSEIIGLKCGDVVFGAPGAYVRCRGKGRKERAIPLTKPTAAMLKAWLHERKGEPEQPLFTNARGLELSRDGVAYILGKHVETASRRCRSLLTKRISPHVLRHTNAVNLLRAGVDQAVIALWLGHESVETTQVYLHADIEYKQKILAQMGAGKGRRITYRADDRLLEFLNDL